MKTVRDIVICLIDKKEHYPISDDFIEHYQQSKGGYIKFAENTGHLIDPKRHEPNQKWHFFESWLIPSFLDGTICWHDNAEKVVYNRLQCPELLLWILEAVGVEPSKVEAAKEIAEAGKNEKVKVSKIAKDIRSQVTWKDVEDAMKLEK